jgi:predicted RNA-binding protein
MELLDMQVEEQADSDRKHMADPKLTNEFQINGLKARESKIIEIPVLLKDPKQLAGFYKNYDGVLETTVQYNEFATSTVAKNAVLIFPEIKNDKK